MLCPECKTEMRIVKGRNVAEGDNSPMEVTRIYRLQDIRCLNRQCPRYNQPNEHKIPLEL